MGDKKKIPEDDGKWHEVFRKKVTRDMERKHAEKEKRLEEAESQRILRLKILGILRDEEMEEEERRERERQRERQKTRAQKQFDRRATRNHSSLFRPEEDIATQMQVLDRLEEAERRRKHRRHNSDDDTDSDGDSNDRDDTDASRDSDDNVDDEERERTREERRRKRNKNKRRQRRSDESGDNSNSDNDDDDADKNRQRRRQEEERQRYREEYLRRKHNRAEESSDDEDYSHLPTYITQLGRTHAVEKKEVHAGLEKLYEEEDLQRLYKEAETLVKTTPQKTTQKRTLATH